MILNIHFPGKDACGVCNGTNSTCLDCEGVPNGLKVKDLCNECRLPDSPEFNTGCGTNLGAFQPVVGYVGGMEIRVEASSVEGVNATCWFVSHDDNK